MNNYGNLCDRTQDIMYMLKFLNYAYNQPYYENEAWELGNEERAGGQLILFHVMDEVKRLDTDIREYINK